MSPRFFVLFSFILLFIHVIHQEIRGNMKSVLPEEKSPWQVTAEAKRNQIMSKIPREWWLSREVIAKGRTRRRISGDFIEDLLDADTQRITSLDSVEIVENIRNGSISAELVVKAFCKRAAYGHQLNQNLLDFGFDQAMKQAKILDMYQMKHGKLCGPLHGLPVSLKDQFHVGGMETTMGYVGWTGTFEGYKSLNLSSNAESELVRELHSLGAIPIAKTTLTQSLWSGETNNNILGYLLNPNNQDLSAGGSSGGEGAIQALRGSSIGFGTDIGGSVSMPAAFNGVYSIKPSVGRLSLKNVPNSSPGQIIIPTVPGILGPTISSLRLVFRSLLSTKPWKYDPEVFPLPWRDEAEYRREHKNDMLQLSFGYLPSDGIVSPQPPILRALQITIEALMAEGHEIIDWKPPSHEQAANIHSIITRGDGSSDVLNNIKLSGEPLVPEIHSVFPTGSWNRPISLLEFEKSILDMNDFRTKYHWYWNSTAALTTTGMEEFQILGYSKDSVTSSLLSSDLGHPVDAVILPITTTAAVIPGKSYYYTYSNFVNVLDYCNVVIPVTMADAKLDIFDRHYKPFNEQDRKNWEAYNAQKYDGAPASIQILGRRLEEEKLLSIAAIVVDALEKYQKRAMRKGGKEQQKDTTTTPRTTTTA